MTNIGDRIVALRKAARLKQIELARMVGMTISKLCRIEKGYTEPRQTDVEKIAKALGCSMSDFYKPLEQLISDQPVDPAAGGEG